MGITPRRLPPAAELKIVSGRCLEDDQSKEPVTRRRPLPVVCREAIKVLDCNYNILLNKIERENGQIKQNNRQMSKHNQDNIARKNNRQMPKQNQDEMGRHSVTQNLQRPFPKEGK